MKSSQMYFIVGQMYFALSILSQDIASKICLVIGGTLLLIFAIMTSKMENEK